jgi:hypothetical protein
MDRGLIRDLNALTPWSTRSEGRQFSRPYRHCHAGSLKHGHAEERVVGVAVAGNTFRERYKSMWLIAKQNEMRQAFEAEAVAVREPLPNRHDDNR